MVTSHLPRRVEHEDNQTTWKYILQQKIIYRFKRAGLDIPGCFHASAVECATFGFAAGIYAAVPYHQHSIL